MRATWLSSCPDTSPLRKLLPSELQLGEGKLLVAVPRSYRERALPHVHRPTRCRRLTVQLPLCPYRLHARQLPSSKEMLLRCLSPKYARWRRGLPPVLTDYSALEPQLVRGRDTQRGVSQAGLGGACARCELHAAMFCLPRRADAVFPVGSVEREFAP